jgi:hypothetical protein
MAIMLILVIVPCILINIWLSRREQLAKKQRGFEPVMGDKPVPQKTENHGPKSP